MKKYNKPTRKYHQKSGLIELSLTRTDLKRETKYVFLLREWYLILDCDKILKTIAHTSLYFSRLPKIHILYFVKLANQSPAQQKSMSKERYNFIVVGVSVLHHYRTERKNIIEWYLTHCAWISEKVNKMSLGIYLCFQNIWLR